MTFDRNAGAEVRIRRALDSIQEAERLVAQAARALAPIPALAAESKSLDSVSDRLTRAWWALSAAANRRRRNGQPEPNRCG